MMFLRRFRSRTYGFIAISFAIGCSLVGWSWRSQKAGVQTEMLFESEDSSILPIGYLSFLPKDYYEDDRKRPLLMHLHGVGERGDNLSKLKRDGLPLIVEKDNSFPFILVSPQCPEGMVWEVESLNALLSEVIGKYRVDPDRIYLTGSSMGGSGAWKLAAAHPDRFAAVIPICGKGDPATAERFKDLPVWAFHGKKDHTVPLSTSQEMVAAIQAIGGNAKLTIYSNVGHESWMQTYENREVFDWLLTKIRSHASTAAGNMARSLEQGRTR